MPAFDSSSAKKAAAARWRGERKAAKAGTDPKARRMAALADLAELKAAEQRGRLVDRGRVEGLVFALARSERDALLALPARIAATVAAELRCDARNLEALLARELRRHLETRAAPSLELGP